MSSCLSGSGRAYRLESLEVEITKSPSTNSWLSNSSSPSSTLSDSSHCNPLVISTRRKPRTPRKRPNQTYNEAVALLSTAYPKIFPAKNLKAFKPPLLFEPSNLIMPFNYTSRLIQRQNQIQNQNQNPVVGFNPICHSPGEINSSWIHGEDYEENDVGADFDAESMLDEELGEGIDSIMGNCGAGDEKTDDIGFCYGYPVGIGVEFGYGVRRETRAMRDGDEGDWWRFPSVEVRHDIMAKTTIEKKKNNNDNRGLELIKNLEVGEGIRENLAVKEGNEDCTAQRNVEGLHLKLNYDIVLDEWAQKGSPFSGDSPASQSAGNDLQTRLAQIDLFLDNGGIREASVLRYKEKRRNRLFSKKIRYQVRKVNADRRPRMKGRFVRTPNSSDD